MVPEGLIDTAAVVSATVAVPVSRALNAPAPTTCVIRPERSCRPLWRRPAP
jgi:hypothetical protein